MKLSSYSNYYGSCLTLYDCRDIVISDYSTHEPSMLSKFKWSRRTVIPSKLHTTKPIPLSEYGDQVSLVK